MLDTQTAPQATEPDHWHQCPSCEHIWGHTQDLDWSKDQFMSAHTCPVCKSGTQFWKCNQFGGPWEFRRA